MDWAQVLVIVLAVLFAIFLVITIVLAVILLKITRQIKSATASAQRTMHALEGSTKALNSAAMPLMITKAVIRQLRKKSRK